MFWTTQKLPSLLVLKANAEWTRVLPSETEESRSWYHSRGWCCWPYWSFLELPDGKIRMAAGKHHSFPPQRYLQAETRVTKRWRLLRAPWAHLGFNNSVLKGGNEGRAGIFPLCLPLNFECRSTGSGFLKIQQTLTFFFFQERTQTRIANPGKTAMVRSSSWRSIYILKLQQARFTS